MHCPFCGAHDTKVIDSRLVAEGDQVRRRRECLACQERFTTFETAELVLPRVIKQDGRRQPFDEDKLRAGFQRALEKRPVSVEQIEAAIGHIKHRLRATGEREVDAIERRGRLAFRLALALTLNVTLALSLSLATNHHLRPSPNPKQVGRETLEWLYRSTEVVVAEFV